jgi:hypothetical protein
MPKGPSGQKRKFFVLVGLAMSSAALAQTESQTPPLCALQEPNGPRSIGHGAILGIQDSAVSRAGIAAREAQRGGAIDPRYLNDLRVTVRQDDGIVDNFDVSAGMTVHVGDRVRLQGSYRSKASACSYIPHMVIPNDVPAV